MTRLSGTPFERLMQRREITEDGCWEWTGANSGGYGVIAANGRICRCHRVAWEYLCGPIPEETPELDHLCQNKICFNPAHLEPVTHGENIRRAWGRRLVCARGLHDLTVPGAFEVINRKRGYRGCVACRKAFSNAGLAERRRLAREARQAVSA